MKVFLMYRDQDFNLDDPLPWNEPALVQDLGLDIVLAAMARGDNFLYEVARKGVLMSLCDITTIIYRQDVLKDCLKNQAVIRNLYDTAVELIESRKKHYLGILSRYPSSVLYSSLEILQVYIGFLKKLRNIAEQEADKFESEGFARFFAMLSEELDEEFFSRVEAHLAELKFRDGVLISAELGKGNEGSNYVLRKPHDEKEGWLKRIFTKKTPVYSYYVHERDEAGAKALAELKDRGINLVANALAQSADHILSFFTVLRTELAFYIGCLNLYESLISKGLPLCFPLPGPLGERRHSFKGLYDVGLALRLDGEVVPNDMNADHKNLVVITGANQGGKSTFLASLGLAQLMMQCGMFVPAEAFSANVCDGIFTHYRREEDVTMESGKLDEELRRMSEIVERLTLNSMLLMNESFAATNEREGSEIAYQITSALLEKGIKVFFVTHLYEFAHRMYRQPRRDTLFLRAGRRPDGMRTFKIAEGEPLETSYGQDLYDRIFGQGV